MKTHLLFVRDHSGSMRGINEAALRDYNQVITSVRDAALVNRQDTYVSVVECGYGTTSGVRRDVVGVPINSVYPLTHYRADGGGTPLFDSVGECITIGESVPDALDPQTAFVVMVTTDGYENASLRWGNHNNSGILSGAMQRLQATDRWTFAFRVPRGRNKQYLISMGIPEWNILEWDQTEAGMDYARDITRASVSTYYAARASGATSTQKFFADLSNVSSTDVKAKMLDISPEVLLWPVSSADDGKMIREFVEIRLKEPYVKGAAFYQLMKSEKVQGHKRLIIRDKKSNAVYEGLAARQMLGLPTIGEVRVNPGNLGDFDLFIQSTSVNRKVNEGTNVLYWRRAV